MSRGKTKENFLYEAKQYGAGVGELSCVEGQNGQLQTWADLTGSEIPKICFPYKLAKVPMIFLLLTPKL